MIRLAQDEFDAAAEYAAFVARQQRAGAVASFLGIVRPETDAPETDVKALFIDYHPALTLQAIEAAAAEARARWPLDDLAIVHRTGDVPAGGVIVLVAVASAHRRAAFEACDYLMDFLKTDAPFWKKEIRRNGACWVEPRAQDYEDRRRWAREG